MSYTERFTEVHDLLAHIPPLGANAQPGEHNTGWVDVSNYHRAVVLINPGECIASETIDVDIEEARDANGTGAQNVKSITQIVCADSGEHPVAVELRMEELTQDYTHINAEVTVGGLQPTMYYYDLLLFGIVPRYPAVPTALWGEIVP